MPAAETAQSLVIADLRLPTVDWQDAFFEIGKLKIRQLAIDLKDEGLRSWNQN